MFWRRFVPQCGPFTFSPPFQSSSQHIFVTLFLGFTSRESWQTDLREHHKFQPCYSRTLALWCVWLSFIMRPCVPPVVVDGSGYRSQELALGEWQEAFAYAVSRCHTGVVDFFSGGESRQTHWRSRILFLNRLCLLPMPLSGQALGPTRSAHTIGTPSAHQVATETTDDPPSSFHPCLRWSAWQLAQQVCIHMCPHTRHVFPAMV